MGLGTAISGPARTWAAKLPEAIPRLEERLSFMRAPINTLQGFLHQVEDFGSTGPSPNAGAPALGSTLLTNLFTGTRNFASGFFTTVLFVFFLLVSGDIFVHRLVEILPRFSETPMLLARRFTLNPVLVIISLVFWFWMWGVPGMILSMPMLAITKIICDRLQPLAAFGHFLEG